MLKKTVKYVVRLTREERDYLIGLTKKGKVAARKLIHARILLRADASEAGANLKDDSIKDLENISSKTVCRVRQRFVEEGLEAALNHKGPSRTKPRKLDGEQEARLIAICCSKAPEGRSRWTLRLLADQLVSLDIVESIATETVRQTLKKTNLSLG
jgi:transposase